MGSSGDGLRPRKFIEREARKEIIRGLLGSDAEEINSSKMDPKLWILHLASGHCICPRGGSFTHVSDIDLQIV